MWSENRIPIEPNQGNRPIHRHHTARYYAHIVKESLTRKVSKLICAIFLALLFLVGLITFILWLSLRPHRPRFHVQQLSIPGLGQGGGFENAQIIYNVTARNANQNIGIYYDEPMQLSVTYQGVRIGGQPVLAPFYQGPKNTTILEGQLGGATLTLTSQQWQQFMGNRARGEVVFQIEITSVLRFKISTWDSKRHTVHANCPAGVGPDGLLLPRYRIRKCPVYFR